MSSNSTAVLSDVLPDILKTKLLRAVVMISGKYIQFQTAED